MINQNKYSNLDKCKEYLQTFASDAHQLKDYFDKGKSCTSFLIDEYDDGGLSITHVSMNTIHIHRKDVSEFKDML